MSVNLVVDASVAIKWVVEEEGRDSARAFLADESLRLIAPAFLVIEAANVLGTKVSRGQMEPLQAERGLKTIRQGFVELVADEELADEALQIAMKLGHPAYDCTYLACAEKREATLITADKRFLNKLQGAGELPPVRALRS